MTSITDKERLVLTHAQIAADRPVAELARRTGLSAKVVRATVQKLEADGRIHRYVEVNDAALGLASFAILVALNARGFGHRAAMEEVLGRAENVVWAFGLCGAYDLEIHARAKSEEEVHALLSSLDPEGDRLGDVTILRRCEYRLYQRGYLAQGPHTRESVGYSLDARPVLDAADTALVHAWSTHPDATLEDLSRMSGVPRSTVEFRLRRLAATGAVAGCIMGLRYANFPAYAYRAYLRFRDLRPSLSARMWAFFAASPHVVSVTRFEGTWNFGVTLEVEHPAQLHSTWRALKAAGGDHLLESELVLRPEDVRVPGRKAFTRESRLSPAV